MKRFREFGIYLTLNILGVSFILALLMAGTAMVRAGREPAPEVRLPTCSSEAYAEHGLPIGSYAGADMTDSGVRFDE